MNRIPDKPIDLTPTITKTRLELAQEYYVSVRTLSRRLKKNKINLPHGLIFPNEIKKIYNILGIPAKLKVNNPEKNETG